MQIFGQILILFSMSRKVLCAVGGRTQALGEDMMSGLDSGMREKFQGMIDYMDPKLDDNDATVDRTNLPTYPTPWTCTLFRQKISQCMDYLEPAAEKTHYMVNDLIRDGHLRSKRVEKAMREIDKEDFAPMDPLNKNHYDYAIDLGYGTWMEPPHQIAGILEYLKTWLTPSSKILEIGSGTGYMSALFATMGANVYAIEHVPEMSRRMKDSFIQGAPRVLFQKKVRGFCMDGRSGLREHAPYDVIYISAAVPDIPWNIMQQLKPAGVLLLTLDKLNSIQTLTAVYKHKNMTTSNEELNSKIYLPPLADLKIQLDKKG